MFVENFCIYIHQGYWSTVFFPCGTLTSFGSKVRLTAPSWITHPLRLAFCVVPDGAQRVYALSKNPSSRFPSTFITSRFPSRTSLAISSIWPATFPTPALSHALNSPVPELVWLFFGILISLVKSSFIFFTPESMALPSDLSAACWISSQQLLWIPDQLDAFRVELAAGKWLFPFCDPVLRAFHGVWWKVHPHCIWISKHRCHWDKAWLILTVQQVGN